MHVVKDTESGIQIIISKFHPWDLGHLLAVGSMCYCSSSAWPGLLEHLCSPESGSQEKEISMS